MSSILKFDQNLNSIKNIQSKRRTTGWVPTHQTLLGKILIGLASTVFIGGLCAVIIAPLAMSLTKQAGDTSANTSTTVTTITTTTVTTTTSVTTASTTTSVTTTVRLPISCFSTVTASGFYSGAGTATAQGDGLVDRPNTTGGAYFNAGGYPTQYVQLELPGLYNITNICLLIIQSPNGATRHQITVGPNSTSLQLVTDMSAATSNGQWLNITYNPVLTNVRFVCLTTLTSPSWVAWAKFTVYDF